MDLRELAVAVIVTVVVFLVAYAIKHVLEMEGDDDSAADD